MILSTDLPKLRDYLDEIFLESSADSIAEMVGPTIFGVQETEKWSYEYQVEHGVSGIKELADGEELPEVTAAEGDSITWTQREFGAKVTVTARTRKFNDYNSPKITAMVRSVTEDAWEKIDQSLADVLLHGFSASNYTDVYGKSVPAVGPDGVCVFSASHSNNLNSDVFSNLIVNPAGTTNPGVSREAIVASRAAAAVHKDANGIIRPVKLDTVLVSPQKYDETMRIVNSEGLSGEFTRDYNPIKGLVKVIMWPRLAALPDGTDTSAYWFMFDSKKVDRSLKLLWAKRPMLEAPEQVLENNNWIWKLNYYYSIGRAFPAYVWGSQGTN
ncbi:MAG: hypothetical protein M0R06_08195 [Sphaerochaeta sp.]|jgi:hypothetical protein|nr:hypothetical protein [Sphaerochaeta sp.]